MNKKLLIGAAAGCAIAGGVAAARTHRDGEPKPTMWVKMRQLLEEMPEDFPPRIMFDNLQATRANTDEILALLRDDSAPTDDIEVLATT